MHFESLGQWHEQWGHLLFSAPDKFNEFDGNDFVRASDQARALEDAFDVLLSGFHFAEKKIKDPRRIRIVRELIEMSREAFRAGDQKRGCHVLQEGEGMIWTGRALPVKHAVEAEQRAFGELVLYAAVRVSPYPCEGTAKDLSSGQATLLATAQEHCREIFAAKKEFKFLAWALRSDGSMVKIQERSKNAAWKYLEAHARDGSARAGVIAELVISPVNGLIVFALHEVGCPSIEAIAKTGNWDWEPLRFHLNDPMLVGSNRASAQSS